MALGVKRSMRSVGLPNPVMPVQIPNKWIDAIDPGGITVVDATPIVNPGTQIIDPTRHIVAVAGFGTTLRARLLYDRAETGAPTTQLVIQVFGRFDANENWQKLVNKDEVHAVTMTLAGATDVDDGSVFKYTDLDLTGHAWDLDGCDEILVGVNVALNNLVGNEALAKLQVKVL